MFAPTEQRNMQRSNDKLKERAALDAEHLLESLHSGRIARRIVDVARLAVANDMLQEAKVMRATVEPEDSAK